MVDKKAIAPSRGVCANENARIFLVNPRVDRDHRSNEDRAGFSVRPDETPLARPRRKCWSSLLETNHA